MPERVWLAVKHGWESTTPLAVFMSQADAEAFVEASKASGEDDVTYGADSVVEVPLYRPDDRSLRFDRYWSAGVSVWRETGAVGTVRTCEYLTDLRDDDGVVDAAGLSRAEPLPNVKDGRDELGHLDFLHVHARAETREEAVRLTLERAEQVAEWVHDGCPETDGHRAARERSNANMRRVARGLL